MLLVNTKRLRELKKENDELKTIVQRTGAKNENISQLDDMLKEMRMEIAELQNQKANYSSSLQQLKETETNAQIEIEKLNKEVEHLKQLKTYEKNEFVTIADRLSDINEINGNGNGKTDSRSVFIQSEQEIINAQNKKKELQREVADLEHKLKELYQRIVELTEQQKNLNNNIDKKSKQLDAIESYRLIDASAELDQIENRISQSKELEKKSNYEFQQRINKLNEQEKELQKKVTSRLRELEDLEKKLVKKTSEARKDSENKMLAKVVEEQKLIDSIESKRNKIEELNMTISSLEEERTKVSDDFDTQNNEQTQISLQHNTQAIVRQLQNQANKIKDQVNQLKMTEELKRELIAKLKDELSTKEIEFAALENDFTTKSNRLKEVSIKNQELAEEIEFQNNQLNKLDGSIANKQTRFKEYENTIAELEERINHLNNEITQRELLKSEAESKFLTEKDKVKKLEEKQKSIIKDLKELESRQREIHNNNKIFENRFAQLFDKYSSDVNEMNRKRGVLEQMLQKKEKDINEHDEIILEKLAILDETEKVLSIRQKEVDSFDDLLKIIHEQKELLKFDLEKLDEKSIEKKLQNQELKVETDVLRRKISEFEKSLVDIFNQADGRIRKSMNKREKLDGEIRDYEIRLKDLNASIKDSMNELVDLQTAIGKIKIEHEEHRIEINKLAGLKNKLQDEINKSKVIVDKYKKIKDRIRQEQEAIKKRREERLSKELKPPLIHSSNTSLPDLTKMFKL